MAACLVEQHTTAARADDHRHRPRRRRSSGQLEQRPASGLAGQVLDVVVVEQLEADSAPERLVAGLHAGVAAGDGHHREERAHLVVFGEQAIGVGDQDPTASVGIASRDLADGPAGRARSVVRATQQVDLAALADGLGQNLDRRRPLRLLTGELHLADTAPAASRRRGGRLGCGAEPLVGEISGVGEAGRVAQ